MIKIKNYKNPSTVTPADMPNAAVGIIRKWSVKGYIGLVVMKVNDEYLMCLDPVEHARIGGWSNLDCFDEDDFQVEILPSGTVIEITLH